MMFNNYLYEKAVRDRHKDVQREMEQLHLLASLQRPRHHTELCVLVELSKEGDLREYYRHRRL